MQTVLWGRDHTELGEVAIHAVSDDVACAITRGLRRKAYRYVDPNEDTVAAVVGPRGTLLVVADGHNGAEAADAAVTTVLERLGDDPPPADLSDAALVELFSVANDAVLHATASLRPPNAGSRTTLTMALVAAPANRPSVPRRLQWASMGDSALIIAVAGNGEELTRPQHQFVGHPMSVPEVAGKLQRGLGEIPADAWVVVVSDGFTNFVGPDRASRVVADIVATATEPATAARAIVDRAGAMGAGDNVAVAVAAPIRLILPEPPRRTGGRL
ncbi:hypothetical protein BH23ACT7_BH23ACT7_11480 [soil metagenome]|jgi:serine/threonine protein phosphatase PrpC|nr:protein phosphatase 2C domain-containing protein [Euzebyaceae bacterium]